MKKFGLAILIPIFHLVFFIYSGMAQEVKGPKMVIRDPVFDFKEVKEGEVLDHTFKVFNQGDQDLVIKKVKPG
jgi:hypothetical protein